MDEIKKNPMRIEFEPFIDEGARQFIVHGVDNYNIAATSLPDYFPVNFVLRGERGDVLGGVLGQLWGGWLQVTYLWVAEAARGVGHGTRLMQDAEASARSRGAIGATVETHSFQARPFAASPICLCQDVIFGRDRDTKPVGSEFFLMARLRAAVALESAGSLVG